MKYPNSPDKKHAPLVSRVPAPITPVTGTHFWKPPDKPSQVPLDLDLPSYYPRELEPQTRVIIRNALKKFPKHSEIVEASKQVAAAMTPLFSRKVKTKALRGDLVDSCVSAVIHSLLQFNCRDSSETFRLETEAKNSREWELLETTIAGQVDSPYKHPATAQNPETTLDSRPPKLDHKMKLGKWADERLAEAQSFSRCVRGGDPPESLRATYPTLFSEVFDKLTDAKRASFFEEAQRRKLTTIDLLNLIADVKEMSGYTLKDYRARYNRSRKQTSSKSK